MPATLNNDAANGALPAGVVVEFPLYGPKGYLDVRPVDEISQVRVSPLGRQTYDQTWATLVTLADCGLTAAGLPGQHHILDNCPALAPIDNAATPHNQVALRALAVQLATDYYQERRYGVEEVYPGVRRWDPEPTHDVLWSYQGGWAATRAFPSPWNAVLPEFFHQTTIPGFPAWPVVRADVIVPVITQVCIVKDSVAVPDQPDIEYAKGVGVVTTELLFREDGRPPTYGLSQYEEITAEGCTGTLCPDWADTPPPGTLHVDLAWECAGFCADQSLTITGNTQRWSGSDTMTCAPAGHPPYEMPVTVELIWFGTRPVVRLTLGTSPGGAYAVQLSRLAEAGWDCSPLFAEAIFQTDFAAIAGCGGRLVVTITE